MYSQPQNLIPKVFSGVSLLFHLCNQARRNLRQEGLVLGLKVYGERRQRQELVWFPHILAHQRADHSDQNLGVGQDLHGLLLKLHVYQLILLSKMFHKFPQKATSWGKWGRNYEPAGDSLHSDHSNNHHLSIQQIDDWKAFATS